MVQACTADCGNSLRRHWLHGEQTNSRTGTAQRDTDGILNRSQLYANQQKPGWCLKHQPGTPLPTLLPLSRGSESRPSFLPCASQRPSVPAAGSGAPVGPRQKQPKHANLRQIRWFPRADRGVCPYETVQICTVLQPRRRVQGKALCAADEARKFVVRHEDRCKSFKSIKHHKPERECLQNP